MTTPEDRRRSPAKAGLIVIQALSFASLVPWMIGVAFTFVSIGGDGIPHWVIAVWSYPLWVVAASGAAWRLFARRKYRAAAVVSALPLVPAAVLFGGQAILSSLVQATEIVRNW